MSTIGAFEPISTSTASNRKKRSAGWGRSVVVGGVKVEVVSRCERCVVITHDPETMLASPELLRVLNETHETSMGLYCRVTRPGRVAASNQVQVV